MTDTDHVVVTIVVIVALSAAAVLSGFQADIVAILSGALGWILGFWFGKSQGSSSR